MKTTKMLAILVLALAIMVCVAQVSEAAPMGTAFTYQGRLIDTNSAADGLYDFAFKLYDANVAGSKVGSDVNEYDVDVIDGYFTVELDFGSGVFNGNAVWLGIGVRPGEENDPCEYTPLVPRQEVTPSPYALYAKTAGSASGGGWVDDGAVVRLESSGDSVGIGTAGPGDKLDVAGHINSSESYKLDGYTILANTGTDNILVGKDAGASITTGYNNSAMGSYALRSNSTGYYNSAMGGYALNSNTTGDKNSAMGCGALNSNTEGYYNSAMGFYALYSNTEGYYNSAMGSSALSSNTTGTDNSAVGYKALYSNTTGNYNSAMGYQADYYNEEGSRNTIIGYQAGRGTAYHNKSGNIFVGYKAGYYETGDNKLYIENSDSSAPLIYGEFDNGRVGINTNSPQGTLDVVSTTGAFIVPRMTTAQRDALTAVNGMIIYNTSTNQFNFYENGSWVTK